MSLLAEHPHVQFNFFRGGIGILRRPDALTLHRRFPSDGERVQRILEATLKSSRNSLDSGSET